MSELLTTLHVVGAVFIIGPLAVLPMIGLQSVRTGDGKALRRLATTTNLFALLSLIVFVLGFGALALSDAKYDLSVTTPWIAASIILYLVAVSLILFVTAPVMRTEARALSEATTAPVSPSRSYGKIAGTSGIASLAFVAIVVLMVWKP